MTTDTAATPPTMSVSQYAAFQRRLVAMFVFRVACAGLLIYFWNDLDTIGKVLGIAVAAVVVPNLGSIKRVFVPYERYLRESR